jgi:hypothetical protein
LDHGDRKALSPLGKLGSPGGPEGVPGAKHDLLAQVLVVAAQLGDGGGLAHPVHAHHQDHPALGLHGLGLLRVEAQLPQGGPALVRLQHSHQLFLHRLLQVLAARGPDFLKDLLGGGKAHVGGQEGHL